MTSPWGGLDAATTKKQLYLNPTVISTVNRVFEPYEESLEALIKDSLDENTGCFGTNPLGVLVQKVFDDRGREVNEYLTEQLSQTRAFVKTARDAAEAMRTSQND